MTQKPNRLTSETSPYLQQHANNPVDWYPWGEEALNQAKETGKPILLSIGYSACHWCHVMAHESFEDEETAQIMNKNFINIKVDREERPDLDKIYQTSLQLLTGKAGGWPLTMFLTPDEQIPFFGGTYFAKKAGFGTPTFKQVLLSVFDYFQHHHSEIHELTAKMQQMLEQLTKASTSDNILFDTIPLIAANQELITSADAIHGGFGQAPKFPHTTSIDRLLRDGTNNNALNLVNLSLTQMAQGGIYDQLGGGFFRYSVDQSWTIPHFEKMLYDNALLLELYSYAYIATKNPLYKTIAIETAEWVIREMQDKEGGYYSTINADSEHIEGKFYYWDREEIKSILNNNEYKIIEHYFGLNLEPNFEHHWHLRISEPLAAIATDLQQPLDVIKQQAESARHKLFLSRQKRIKPDRDDKILTSWNGLMIKAMTIAGLYLNQPKFIDSAQLALQFIEKHLTKDQRLLASYKDGQAHLMGYLDDYAFMLDAILTFLQARWSNHLLQLAITLAEKLATLFFDAKDGGFYFTAKDHESLIQRPKPYMDEATPSGNGIASYSLQRLGYLLGNQKYLELSQRTLQVSWHAINQMPSVYCSLLLTLTEHIQPPAIVILRGDRNNLEPWQACYYQYYLPQHLCFSIPSSVANLPVTLDKSAPDQGVFAYICQENTCLPPIHSLEDFESYLKAQTDIAR